MADGLSQQITQKTKMKKLSGMQISVNAIWLTTNVPECMTVNELKEATYQDKHLQ